MENTFPIYKVDAIVQFFRTEVLTGQESKHFAKGDVTPNPKVSHYFNFMPRSNDLHNSTLDSFILQADVIQRLYMRILQIVYRFRPECHYLVSNN